MSSIEYRSVGEVKADDLKPRTLRGFAAIYEKRADLVPGRLVEIIKRGAFKGTLDNKRDVRFLVEHDEDRILGRTKSGTLELRDSREGLAFELSLPDTTDARDLFELVKRGDISGMSFGFKMIKDDIRKESGENGKSVIVRELEEAELREISATSDPVYQDTKVFARSFVGVVEECEKRLADFEAETKRDTWLQQQGT